MIAESSLNETTSIQERRKKPLCSCVRSSLQRYFSDLDGHAPGKVYDMVIAEIEAPLLEEALKYTKGNQSKTAELLGLNRGTLRKKMRRYNLL